jgi:8-oxo-dGTP diphosphatase
MEKVLRLSAKALIVRDQKLLVIRKRDENQDYFLLPGGGQEHGETLPEVVRREVLEETGYRVRAGDLVFVRDYIGANHEFAKDSSHFHQVEFYFKAELESDHAEKPTIPDDGQTGIEWIPLEQVESSRIYPMSLRREIATQAAKPVYRGDVN